MIKLQSSKPRSARRLKHRAILAFTGAFILLATLISIFRWYEFDAKASPVNWSEVGGLTILGIAWIYLLVEGGVSTSEAKRLARIEQGTGVFARWTVDPKSWQELWQQRRLLDHQPGALLTYPKLPPEAPPQGVEIIISQDGLFIGPNFSHPLPPISVLHALLDNSWLEFDCLEDMPNHRLRVPVPANATQFVQVFTRSGQELPPSCIGNHHPLP